MGRIPQSPDFKLAKVMIALAWADGSLDKEEIGALKDLIFETFGELSGEEWAVLEMYMESPVSAEERQALVEEMLAAVRTSGEKAGILEVLRGLAAADGVVSAGEQNALADIERAIVAQGGEAVGFGGLVGRLLSGRLRSRQKQRSRSILRENELRTYLSNRILYDLQRSGTVSGEESESFLRKMCAAAGLLGTVALCDAEFSPDEREEFIRILNEEWHVPQGAAEALADAAARRVARGLDRARLVREFFETTDAEERRRFIRSLFRLANAFGKTSHEEIESIRQIAEALHVPHADFIAAKLTIPREDRHGL